MTLKVSYIPGRQRHYLTGLGEHLATLPIEFTGVSLDTPFSTFDFATQLGLIRDHIASERPSHIIANSYGAYLLLQTFLEYGPYSGKTLLLSPVLGKGTASNRLVKPPRANALMAAFERGDFPKPNHIEIYTGEYDNGCSPELAQTVCDLISADRCVILPHQSHILDRAIVRRIVGDFLK